MNCDQGWQKIRTKNSWVFYKGFNDTQYTDADFAEAISHDPIPKYTGNFFAIIANDDQTVTTTNDIYRGTPLRVRVEDLLITNISIDGTTNVWADRIMQIDQDLNIKEIFFDPYQAVKDMSLMTDDQVVNAIDDLINHSFEAFLTKNTKPIKIFLSGGIDTTTCFSYLKKFTNNFEIIAGEVFEFSQFVCNKRAMLKSLWGYNQLHHFRDSCVLVTGGNGDEEFIRSPTTVNMLLTAMGSDIMTEISKSPECYHHTYFSLPKHQQKYQQQAADPEFNEVTADWDKTLAQVFNTLLHDHQHWHLENTLTFTPLKDLRYTNLILRGSKTLIKGQMLNSDINRRLIEQNDPSLLQYVSRQKNSNTQENCWALYERFKNHIR